METGCDMPDTEAGKCRLEKYMLEKRCSALKSAVKLLGCSLSKPLLEQTNVLFGKPLPVFLAPKRDVKHQMEG